MVGFNGLTFPEGQIENGKHLFDASHFFIPVNKTENYFFFRFDLVGFAFTAFFTTFFSSTSGS